jgi:amino acid transporter
MFQQQQNVWDPQRDLPRGMIIIICTILYIAIALVLTGFYDLLNVVIHWLLYLKN